VNNIRAEFAQKPHHLWIVPQEQKVKLVVAVQGEFGPAAAKLDSGDRSVGYHLIERPSVNEEECQSMFFCKRGELPAGIRHAVYFTVRARK
jgi:hypothetical protein